MDHVEFSKPVRQKIEVSVVFKRKYPQGVIDVIAMHIADLFVETEGIEIPEDNPDVNCTYERIGFRKWKMTMKFIIMNTTTMGADAVLRQNVYALLLDCRARELEIDMERIEQ